MDHSALLHILWGATFCFVLWGIWLHRNNLVHKLNPIPITTTVDTIFGKVVEFWAAKTYHPPKTHVLASYRWSTASPPFLKLNIDGSVLGETRHATAGGLFCDSKDNWVARFVHRIGITNSLATELWALRDGLRFAVANYFTHLKIEIDSSIASQLISGAPTPKHYLSSLVIDCKELMQQLPHVDINHIICQSNMTANAMARLGHDLHQDFLILSLPPCCQTVLYSGYYGV
ncbi:hypothetical protein SLA2020_129850 [Shorea laevis]